MKLQKLRRGKPNIAEQMRMKEVYELSVSVIKKALTSPDDEISLKEKADLATRVYCRMIPKEINFTGKAVEATQIIINAPEAKYVQPQQVNLHQMTKGKQKVVEPVIWSNDPFRTNRVKDIVISGTDT